MRYRRKKIIVDALKWSGRESDLYLIRELGLYQFGYCPIDGEIDIQVMDATLKAKPGDYIVKGMSGEFYPCKCKVFEENYKSVDEYVEHKYIMPSNEETEKRLARILEIINAGGTPREAAKEFGVSHQRIEQILDRSGHNYGDIFRVRQAEKAKIKEEKRLLTCKRICKFCGNEYDKDSEDAGPKYCSRKCENDQRKVTSRERNRIYYKTEQGRQRQLEYRTQNRAKINEYTKNWQRRWREKMTPEQLDAYRAKMAAYSRGYQLKLRNAKKEQKRNQSM